MDEIASLHQMQTFFFNSNLLEALNGRNQQPITKHRSNDDKKK